MQMHDTMRLASGGGVAAKLATAFDITPSAAEAVLRAAMPELNWRLETNTLSRQGLADVVELFGSGNHAKQLDSAAQALRDPAVRTDGEAILGHLLGSKDRSRTVAGRVARQSGLSAATVREMLPALAVVAMATTEIRGQASFRQLLAAVPSLGRWSKGSRHADLADILRRRCGAGPFGPLTLRKEVRRAIARAAGFPLRGPLRWYFHYLLIRPVALAARWIAPARTPQ